MHSHRQPAGARRNVIAKERALPALVQLPRGCEREGAGGDGYPTVEDLANSFECFRWHGGKS